MRVLVADDDEVGRAALEGLLRKWGHEPISAADGAEAWSILDRADAPEIALIDWMMPGLDGIELLRRAQIAPKLRKVYFILITAQEGTEQRVTGLEAGAHDFVTKPFDASELRARLRVAERVVRLQVELAERVRELEATLERERKLAGLLPICSYCKKIRDDGDYWHQVEDFVAKHSGAAFSHSICPECYERVVEPELARFIQEQARKPDDPTPSGA